MPRPDPYHIARKTPSAGVTDYERQIDMAALEWIVTMREGIRLMQSYPGDILEVKYEELCDRPSHTLEKILIHAGLGVEDDKLFDYAEKVLQSTENKGPIRLHSSIEMAFQETMLRTGYGE